jgi:hypothetical protein
LKNKLTDNFANTFTSRAWMLTGLIWFVIGLFSRKPKRPDKRDLLTPWMLTDGGSFFRTGPDVGRAGVPKETYHGPERDLLNPLNPLSPLNPELDSEGTYHSRRKRDILNLNTLDPKLNSIETCK